MSRRDAVKDTFKPGKKNPAWLYFLNGNGRPGEGRSCFPITRVIIIICRPFSSLVVDGAAQLQPICGDGRLLRNPHVDLTLGGCEYIPECIEWGHKAEIECQIQAVNRLYWYTGEWFYQFSWSVIGAVEWTACHFWGCVCTKLPCSKLQIMICNGVIVNSHEGEVIWWENSANESRIHLCWGCILWMWLECWFGWTGTEMYTVISLYLRHQPR